MSKLEKLNNSEILNKKIEIFGDVNNLNLKNYSILSMIKENKNKNSTKTTNSSYINLKGYEFNKFDELNKSLSNISDFDLEKDEEDDSNDLSFNSLEHDGEFESLDIITSKKINKNNKEENREYELELNK